jgi:hypothetical protein
MSIEYTILKVMGRVIYTKSEISKLCGGEWGASRVKRGYIWSGWVGLCVLCAVCCVLCA